MSTSTAQLIKDLSSLTITQANELVKELEKEWGVSAASFAAPAAGGAAQAAVVEEKTEFDVILTLAGDKKMDVIKAVREVTQPQLGLKEAKDLVESAPKTVATGVNKDTAADIKKKLEAAGAKVEVK